RTRAPSRDTGRRRERRCLLRCRGGRVRVGAGAVRRRRCVRGPLMTPAFPSVTELLGSVGDELGPSRWIIVDQERIDGFARVTEDEPWIHVDPARASTGPFGATIAHGYLTLSLVAPIVMELLTVGRLHSAVNYGLNRVRFPAPVRSGGRVRGRVTVVDA